MSNVMLGKSPNVAIKEISHKIDELEKLINRYQ